MGILQPAFRKVEGKVNHVFTTPECDIFIIGLQTIVSLSSRSGLRNSIGLIGKMLPLVS